MKAEIETKPDEVWDWAGADPHTAQVCELEYVPNITLGYSYIWDCVEYNTESTTFNRMRIEGGMIHVSSYSSFLSLLPFLIVIVIHLKCC